MTHDYKYENLREEDRNALIPAFKRKLIVLIDGEPFKHSSADTLTQLEEEAAQWEDWRERNHACALDDAELEREYREHRE